MQIGFFNLHLSDRLGSWVHLEESYPTSDTTQFETNFHNILPKDIFSRKLFVEIKNDK
jgi:hypothetical protein